jgi:hypothetical protein
MMNVILTAASNGARFVASAAQLIPGHDEAAATKY